ncbi:hypothetical protein D3C84_659440 [compost metagenome]
MSSPAEADLRAASFSSAAKPCGIISVTEFQSLTTKPSYFHSSRNIFLSKKLFPEAGTPFRSLNEVINVAAPDFAAASKGFK